MTFRLMQLILIELVIHQNHRFSYGEPMTVESTTQALCDLALRFGEGDEESMVGIINPSYQLISGSIDVECKLCPFYCGFCL